MQDPHATKRYAVIVVDDEYGARLQVELALATSTVLGLVGQASNGPRGAELAERLQPDLVVLDLSMPGMDGFEALPLIRSLAPDAQVLVRSSHDGDEHDVRLRELGATGFIPKFLAPDDLCHLLEAIVREKERIRYFGPRVAIDRAAKRHVSSADGTQHRRGLRRQMGTGTRERDDGARDFQR